MNFSDRIFVAGHKGLVGSALVQKLMELGYRNIITISKQEADLRRENLVNQVFVKYKPDYVFLAAAKVGGIKANSTYPAEYIYDNLMIQSNIIHASYLYEIKKMLFLGSSCIYPKICLQPIREECLLTGSLEPTNESYAIAKIAGVKMCQAYNRQYHTNFISVMPSNLYGPYDHYDLENSHVLPALIRKFHEARQNDEAKVKLWGTGESRREFLYVEDLAEACIFLMENYNQNEIINVGTGKDITIKELANLIKEITNYKGRIEWNPTMPDGTPRKLLDLTKINQLGWKAKVSLKDGIIRTYDWYLNNLA